MARLKIHHIETGLSLRQYLKLYRVFPINEPTTLRGYDCSDERIRYCLSENMSPGFYYYSFIDGRQVTYWLSKKAFSTSVEESVKQ